MSNKSEENISLEYPQENLDELDWIKLRTDMDKVMQDETFLQKFQRKFVENPFVPIGQYGSGFNLVQILNKTFCNIIILIFAGSLATLSALLYGLWSFRTGNKKMSQYMMRTRVAAQGFTVVAVAGGIYLGLSKDR